MVERIERRIERGKRARSGFCSAVPTIAFIKKNGVLRELERERQTGEREIEPDKADFSAVHQLNNH